MSAAVRRVVVTGLGVVSPIGVGLAPFAESLFAGRCGIGPLGLVARDGLGIRIAGEVRDYDPAAHFDARRLGLLDRVSQFALVAARQAVEASGLRFEGELGPRTATILGTGVGGIGTLDEGFHRLYAEGAQRLHPFTIPRLMVSAPTAQVSMEFGLTGPSFTAASACASAAHAIGLAFQMVRGGLVDAAVTGGAEASLSFGALKGWEAMRIVSPDGCRPFCETRNGMVLGEGAAVLVLETLEAAKARGAEVLGEVAGFGMSADAKDITAPDADGAARAMRAALADAGLNGDEVDYVNAHGTGTAANDATEARAIHAVFGDLARRLMVSSTKSMVGHSLGAAGALEAAATLLALRDQVVPPTVGVERPDPACALDVVPRVARDARVGAALSNSFAFGGLNAALAFRRV
ncbi:beta-ketoacyl-[acyl-carrier-protein] synthase family protein [Azospirillum soli]|uniref:beta-ketoacyl-[acyl-carrier-protein] synthase family protein n=1 Tax=Azospirillum soli TaxID=1304799 RepID=UPI0031B851B6|nr:nodulation protein E [Azospirillum soli]